MFQNNFVLPDRVVNTMPYSPIYRTIGVTITTFNEVVMMLLGVLVDAKLHDEVALYIPQIKHTVTTGRSYHGNSNMLLALFK
jgi:hypothetical protein